MFSLDNPKRSDRFKQYVKSNYLPVPSSSFVYYQWITSPLIGKILGPQGYVLATKIQMGLIRLTRKQNYSLLISLLPEPLIIDKITPYAPFSRRFIRNFEIKLPKMITKMGVL